MGDTEAHARQQAQILRFNGIRRWSICMVAKYLGKKILCFPSRDSVMSLNIGRLGDVWQICNAVFVVMFTAWVGVAQAASCNVKDFGAKGDGVTDDAPAIQAAITRVMVTGGGDLFVPPGTYLLNSYQPSPHPWIFYNLRAGSNVMIDAEPRAVFLQGSGGRAALPSGATFVENDILVFGSSNYTVTTFQNTTYNGGFYSLNAITANDPQVTLTTSAQASNFSVGDYVAIYSTTTGDVIPSEMSQVTSVNVGTGVLGLQYELARSFSTPSIAKVTSLATTNVGIKNLILQGAVPLRVNETFGFIAENSTFVTDMSIGGRNNVGLVMNTMRGFRFIRNGFLSIGPTIFGTELPQRNSQDGLFEDNVFYAQSFGFGEYGAHWKFTKNHIWLFPEAAVPNAIALGGLDVSFDSNDVHSSNISVSGGALIADLNGPAFYDAFIGKIRITNNTIDCRADGNNCLLLQSVDPIVMANHISVISGSATGVKLTGPLAQTAHVDGNIFSMQSGPAVALNQLSPDGSFVTNNSITGTGSVGILVNDQSSNHTGGNVLVDNSIVGYTTPVSMTLSKHPGSRVDFNGTSRTAPTTVSGLGSCSATNEGAHWGVTDALSPAVGSTSALVGGGTVHVPAYCNGTSWIDQ